MQRSSMQNARCSWSRLRPTLSWIRGASGPAGPGRQIPRPRVLGSSMAPPQQPVTMSTVAAASSAFEAGVVGDSTAPSICILGGGFGGLYTAIRLNSLMWPNNQKPRITLIDQNDRFVFKPLLYDLLAKTASEDEVAPEYSAILAPYNIRFIRSKVESVSPTKAGAASSSDGSGKGGGMVTLVDGVQLPYDWLVLSLGSDTNLDMAEGAREHAIGFSTLGDVRRADAALSCLEAATADPTAPRPVVSVIGAGYSGVELAATIGERLAGSAAVHLLSPSGDVMPGQAAPLVEAAEKSLLQAGVVTRPAKVTRVAKGAAVPACADLGKKLTLDVNGKRETELSDLVLWTAGTQATTAQQRNGFPFPANDRGMAITDATLRVPGHPHVFAIGDTAAALAGAPDDAENTQGSFPPTAQVAMQQADYVAWNLWASINGRTLLPFKYQHLGTMLTFGRAAGAVKLNLPLPSQLREVVAGSPLNPLVSAIGVKISGSEGGVTVEGPLAALTRRAAYWYRQPTNEQKLRVGASWVTAGLQELQRAMPSNTTAQTSSGGKSAEEVGGTTAAAEPVAAGPVSTGQSNGSVGRASGSTVDV
eukprot:jgi/Ulvmu1/8864/UM049_0046.1